MQIHPYLSFEGRCQEALDFYRDRLGASLGMVMRFKDAPPTDQPAPEGCDGPPPDGEKIMHSELRIGDSTLMATDGMASGKPNFAGISLSLRVRDEAEAAERFAALADGGQVQMPLAKTFFSPAFGMVADRFGVHWLVVAEAAAPA
ncbi:VOC family protein [Pseudorhodoferax sp. Leaf274]|uniref:VOC family protein n=1 Tax=Pseudorhodoferax sp. Leaf274 TaxID=1736318 RepID=UPI000702B952|nr:VOC family protein [Pseudorhodoferax sp. Leaf274]KQP49348.1 3-demethylubiquinone-9 3-methyltransferase [Pseudorhodoferax sp. Leaf274]